MPATAFTACLLLALVPAQAPGMPPLTEDQRARISKLANETQQESARLKSLLEQRQRELARIYSQYELDESQATRIEAEILDLQKQMLASHRQMQVELRKLVGKERFLILKKRLDNFLQSPPAPRSDKPVPKADTKEGSLEKRPSPTSETTPSEPVFSGPQVGEKLPGFTVRGVFDADAGKDLDFVKQAEGKPIVLVFVHDVSRQSVGMVRALTTYTVRRTKDGLVTGVVWLDDDPTQAESTLQRIKHALTPGAPTGIALDGAEGPGSYGLNRKLMLTILVGKEGKVTANFALTQPSLQVDLPKILDAVVAVAGGKAPPLDELLGTDGQMRMTAKESAPNLRPLLAPVIRKDATAAEVERAAAAVEESMQKDAATRREVTRVAKTIVDSGKLANYGTPRAQEFLRQWAKEGASPPSKPSKDAPRPTEEAQDSEQKR